MKMPNNLSMRFYDFCEKCDMCKVEVKKHHTLDNGTHHIIYCEHEDACKRMKEIIKNGH